MKILAAKSINSIFPELREEPHRFRVETESTVYEGHNSRIAEACDSWHNGLINDLELCYTVSLYAQAVKHGYFYFKQ